MSTSLDTSLSTSTAVHVCVVQPAGDRQALAALAPALLLQSQLQALVDPVTLSKNRLRADALNFVFGVTAGWDAEAARGHRCVLVMPEPLDDPAALSPTALRLLQRWPVLVADTAAVPLLRPADRGNPAHMPPVWPWWPHRGQPEAPAAALPLPQRPIDLLHTGQPNERQQALLAGLERLGLRVARLDASLHGPELLGLIGQARAVLALRHSDSARLDATTMAVALAQGTAVLAERGEGTGSDWPPAAARLDFSPQPQALIEALHGDPHSEAFAAAASRSVQAFDAQHDAALATVRHALQAAQAWWAAHPAPPAPVPDRLNDDLGDTATGAYRPGWCNTAASAALQPDALLDLRLPLPPAWVARAGQFQLITLGRERLDTDSLRLDNASQLLADGGRLVLHWPCAQVPAAERTAALDEALAPWTTAFWQRPALFTHGLHHAHTQWLDAQDSPCTPEAARRARVLLQRRETSYHERSRARAARMDLGPL